MRVARARAALVVLGLLALVGGPAAAAPRPADDAPAQQQALPITVAVDALTPVLAPGVDLEASVTLTNAGDEPVQQPRLVLHLDRSSIATRSILERWQQTPPDGPLGPVLEAVDAPGPLAPGASATVTVTVPAGGTGLGTASSWGVRRVAVQVVDRADAARPRLGVARTSIVWFPDQPVTPTGVSVLVPVVGPPVDPYAPEQPDPLVRATGSGGRLRAVLEATADRPEVAWAVDPWLVARAADVAPRWAQDLLDATTGRDVELLPAGDADVAALAHAGRPDLVTGALERATSLAAASGLPAGSDTSLVLPADDLPDVVTAALAQGPGRAVVAGPGQLPPTEDLTYTPSGRTTVRTPSGPTSVLVPDETLSAALRGPADPDPQRTPATAAQELISELAVITRERPSDSRHVLLTVPRDWDPDPEVVRAQLDALTAAPWVRLQPVAALVGSTDDVDRGGLPEEDVAPREITSAEVRALETTLDRRERLVGIAEDPADLLGDVDAELVAPLSVAWRADTTGRQDLLAAARARTEALERAVVVQESSSINLISTSGELPVKLTNTLDQEVTVRVGLRPDDARLVADEQVALTLPARADGVVQIPVHAIQSADVPVTVEVRTPTGELLDDSGQMTVRVRADWEGIGTAVIGALLAIGLVVGLVRTIRRGRTGRRAAPVASGPDALSPEEEAETVAAAPEGAQNP